MRLRKPFGRGGDVSIVERKNDGDPFATVLVHALDESLQSYREGPSCGAMSDNADDVAGP